jgi:NhaP-type Na+/H+ or K+/H+ antiporter
MLGQALGRHLRVPGIVVLLAAGVVLGPDVLGVVRPDTMGGALQALVGFAVAIILFEGGMNLNLRRLRREARSIRQLVTIGALVTAAGGALAARIFLRWDWSLAILFGSLVIVTGPTVITPILRRIRLNQSVATVLEAEGVLIDAIGALIAVVTLEVVLSPVSGPFAEGAQILVLRLGSGALFGVAGGTLIAVLLRFERVIPPGLENVLTLSMVIVLFQGCNNLFPESGIVAVTVAGLMVGNIKTRLLSDLKEFKEQLTVLMIGMLFVLLAADVRIEEVRSLGWPGALTVLALMLVVRPINIFVGTLGSDLTLREKALLSWLAPRGIVAAAVASLFAQEMSRAGIAGGNELRALVFLVIAATVLIQGLSGGWVAGWLGVRRPSNRGFLILGATPLGLELGGVFRDSGREVLFIDANPDACAAAEAANFRVLFGSGLSESILYRAETDSRAGVLAVTDNDEVNLLFVTKARKDFKIHQTWMALRSGHTKVTPAMVEEAGAKVLFAQPRNLDLWSVRIEREDAELRSYVRGRSGDRTAIEEIGNPPDPDSVLIPLAVVRGGRVLPFVADLSFKASDMLQVVVNRERADEAEAWLAQMGWHPGAEAGADEPEAARLEPA